MSKSTNNEVRGMSHDTAVDRIREEFEEWARGQGLSITRTAHALAFANGTRRSVGDYIDVMSLVAWEAWQASRQAVVIELPYYDAYERDLQHETVGECADAIRAAGLKVAQ